MKQDSWPLLPVSPMAGWRTGDAVGRDAGPGSGGSAAATSLLTAEPPPWLGQEGWRPLASWIDAARRIRLAVNGAVRICCCQSFVGFCHRKPGQDLAAASGAAQSQWRRKQKYWGGGGARSQ